MAKKKKRRSGRTRQARGGDSKLAAKELYDNPSHRLNAAQLLWQQGKRNEALRKYDDAMRLEPENVRAYVMAARAYSEAYRLERVKEILERLARRAPEHPGVHHYVGETYSLAKLPERAIAAYEHACTLPGAQPGTWMELASMYERAHRLDEAGDLIARAEQSGLKMPLLSIVKARLQRREKQFEPAETTLRGLIKKLPEDNDWACQAWGEIALMKDRQGDYDGAMKAIGCCKNAQMKRASKFDRGAERVHAQLSTLIDSITRDYFLKWQREAKDLPDAGVSLLTGFPRSGTTLLEQVLDAHPRLVSSEERDYLGKEIYRSVFSGRDANAPVLDVLDSLSPARIRFEREQYLQVMEQLLAEPIGARMHLDKNPAYNLTIPLLLRIFPEARLVVALRDPRDVVLSCFLRYLPLNAVSVRFLTLEKTAQRYALDLSAWLRFRDVIPGPWCEIRYEDSVADLATQARRALATLGLAWDDAVLGYRDRLNKDKQVTSPTYEAVAEPVYTRAIGRWKNYERHLSPVFDRLQPFMDAFGYE